MMTISPTQQALVRQKNSLESTVQALKTLEMKRNELLSQCETIMHRMDNLRVRVDEGRRTYKASLAMAEAVM